ncbi:hypothetical protein N9H21_00400 [bacterium]|nr:hypothetical protein [bacterium]
MGCIAFLIVSGLMIMEKIKESYVKKTNSRVPEILAPLGILLGSCSACSTIPS